MRKSSLGGAVRFLVRAWVFAMLAFAGGLGLTAQDAAAQSFRFTQFVIEGNIRVDDASVLEISGITPGAAVSAGGVNDAAQNLRNSGLFETVNVVPAGSTLRITVIEFPTINRIAFEGNRRLDDADLRAVIRSAERRIYTPSTAEADTAAIVGAYREAARISATVRPSIIRRSDNRVDLVFAITEGRVVENERVSFVGNREFSDRRLRRVVETKQANRLRQLIRVDTFVEERIPLDRQLLTDFYNSRGHVDFQILDVTTEFSRERNASFITFNIREGQSFDIGAITVVSALSDVNAASFERQVRIRSGQTFSPVAIDDTVTRLEEHALDLGLDFIRVDPIITRNNRTLTLDVEFRIVRGQRIFVERIDIEGNATTLDRVVRRQFTTVEGDPFNPRSIRASAERIRALGFFSTADVNARSGSSADQVVIDVDLVEQPTGTLTFGAAYSNESGVGLLLSFNERNFLGRGQRLTFLDGIAFTDMQCDEQTRHRADQHLRKIGWNLFDHMLCKMRDMRRQYLQIMLRAPRRDTKAHASRFKLDDQGLAIDLGKDHPVARRIFHCQIDSLAIDGDGFFFEAYGVFRARDLDRPVAWRMQCSQLAFDPPGPIRLRSGHDTAYRRQRA